jgi:2-oxoglutarate ferredoxin oxidoreductase subunit alpha
MLQVRWGTHGDHEIIALAPNSVQECLDLTIECFNLSERFRNPAILMTDGDVGHMREQITIPDWKDIKLIYRKEPTKKGKDRFIPFKADKSKVPEMALFGKGYHTYATGLTHTEKGLPSTDDQKVHHKLVTRLCDKISDHRDELSVVEKDYQAKSKIGIVSYGIASRSSMSAVKILREKKIKTDYLRLITIWPFPRKEVAELAKRVDKIFVPEMNLGQVSHVVQEYSYGKSDVCLIPKTGGEMHSPQEIVDAIEEGL